MVPNNSDFVMIIIVGTTEHKCDLLARLNSIKMQIVCAQ